MPPSVGRKVRAVDAMRGLSGSFDCAARRASRFAQDDGSFGGSFSGEVLLSGCPDGGLRSGR